MSRPALLLLLALAPPLPAALAATPTTEAPSAPAPVPRLAALTIDAALGRAREHLAARAGEAGREIVGVQFIPPHGRPGPGFWLVDLAPYPSDRPSPAEPFTSLLIAMDGAVEERGGRRPLDPEQQRAREQKAATLHQLMRSATSP